MRKEYINPMKRNGDFADPCVIRYNGQYYLYCTNHDIRCWSSIDLLEWKLEGPVIGAEEFPGLVPFAPEVIYWNGSFYMYTSPHGFGHYVLKSDSPTGPFRKITDNLEHNIDGSVFIDDDGQWYFYWAEFTGIMGCRMKSPTELTEPVNTGAFLHGWTEGPFVMKHRGKYYMTYTGNHYLSSGYRIHGAVSDHPLSGYRDDVHNPLVIHTEGKNIGLGHSTTVLGPDLKSYYMVYHNINPDATRDLNIDLQSWHGQSTCIYGPTVTKQRAPGLPDFLAYPEKEQKAWDIRSGQMEYHGQFYRTEEGEFIGLSDEKMQPWGTAEFNLKYSRNSGSYGILFGWLDGEDYYKLELKADEKSIRIFAVEHGMERLLAEKELPAQYDHAALHCLRIQCDSSGLTVLADNLRLVEVMIAAIGGSIGYYSEKGILEIGFTGFSNGTRMEAERERFKPVPRRLPACTAFSDNVMNIDTDIDMDQEEVSLVGGRSLSYHVNVARSGRYSMNLFGSFCRNTRWQVFLDGEGIGECDFDAVGRGILRFTAILPEGEHDIRWALLDGMAKLESIEWKELTEVPKETVETVDRLGPYGKRLWGDDGWSNYILKAELTMELLEGGEAGVILCATQPSEGGEGNDPTLGINFFQGYFVGWDQTCLILSRHAYDKKILCKREYKPENEMQCKFTVHVEDGTIRIYTDDEKQPFLTYHDEVPFTCGRAGVRVEKGFLEGRLLVLNDTAKRH